MNKRSLTIILIIGLFLGNLTLPVIAADHDTSGVLIVPFQIHAEEDHSFLIPAINDMLLSRLSGAKRDVSVADLDDKRIPINLEAAIAMAREEEVAYVLIGSVTILNKINSTDARLIDINRKKPVLNFNQVGQEQGDIITHIENIAAKVVQFLNSKTQLPAVSPKEKTTNSPPTGEISLTYWKSEVYDTAIQSISIADLDGDGQNEAILIDKQALHIYKFNKDRLNKFKTISDRSFNRLFRVDTADINQNGKAEIFIGNYVATQKKLNSLVLEWNGQAFSIIVKLPNWYLRILETTSADIRLLGQKRGSGSSLSTIFEALFQENVYEMAWHSGRYVSTSKYPLPPGLSLYDFSRGDIANNGQDLLATFNRNDQIEIISLNGETRWKSKDSYGGSRMYFEVPEVDNPLKTTNYYLPQRIHIKDMNGDGNKEIIVLKNHDSAGFLSRVKAFNEAHIEGLIYDNIGTQLEWQTRKFSGYISDYVVADLDNDGSQDIVFSLVEKEASVVSKGRSYVVACSLVK